MLSASSPIKFPTSPSTTKRAKPHDHDPPKPKARGPFVIENDDSDSDDDDETSATREAKRLMTTDPREKSSDTTFQDEPVILDLTPEETSKTPDIQIQEPTLPIRPPVLTSAIFSRFAPQPFTATDCSGKATIIKERKINSAPTYESMVAARSTTKEGRAKRSYYGIDIHNLINAASVEIASRQNLPQQEPNVPVRSIERPITSGKKQKKSLLWTEKYRARHFMDLCGDDGTNRLVLKWLKRWDPVVFPGSAKSRSVARRPGGKQQEEDERPHRKILMLTGPPGLGKTTLAHVCARQAGYEVMEINASDDRSRDVVKNRIRTSLGTESVKNISNRKDGEGLPKLARPACVVVDEVDGVVSGSGASGEGGFVKALIDLVLLDQKNAAGNTSSSNYARKKKGDDFRLLRPLVLICNDVYAPALRPLRHSNLAEIIRVGKPTMEAVVARLKTVFEKEGISCDKDAARKLCEAAWGMTSGIDSKRGAESTVEGDLRGVMVVGEWVAGRFRASSPTGTERLTRQWLERNVLQDLTSGAGGARGLGRGGVKDIVTRLFQEGGGFPKQAMDLSQSKTQHEQPKTELGFGEYQKKHAMERLRQMIDTSGEISHIMTEIFAEYPNRDYNDDLYLTKPNQAYEWMYFHDTCQSRLYASQEWELAQYLSQPVLACHHLFASPRRHFQSKGYDRRWGGDTEDDSEPPLPFSGPRADYEAFEAERQNKSQLQALQGQLPPTLMRSFRSAEDVAAEFLPYLARIVSPDVKPVVIGGSQGSMASVRKESERKMVKRAAQVLAEVGIELQKGRIESDSLVNRAPEYVYRMEPDLDVLATFETGASLLLPSAAPTRYAVRQVLDQELKQALVEREALARQSRFQAGNPLGHVEQLSTDKLMNAKKIALEQDPKDATLIKRDFFGRIIEARPLAEIIGDTPQKKAQREDKERKVWVTYHEGLNNAVRKPMSLQEFMKGL
ncbi:chromosome transmission fidelity 18 [Fusarium heterosporum]|uniref:Chromosome transmission fidelity 18 n=1 Tax=Fusarium heterosporum TaxID=42747 RepID=A0A8H5TY17_FUSHE|nr:chromosome transmission fidelity 18 [Fusarium heterosporum]